MKLYYLLFKYLRIIRYLLKGMSLKKAVSKASYKTVYKYALGHSARIDYIPDTFNFHIMHCNLSCPNCYYSLKNSKAFTDSSFIPVEKFEKLLDSYPFRYISLTGGEALLHPQFDKLIEACVRRGLSVSGSSNGILVKKHINALKHFRRINISTDSYDYNSFKKYRNGSKEAFDLIIEGLRALRENNINFTISFLMSAENIHEYPKILDFAAKYKPSALVLHSINVHGTSKYTPLLSTNVEIQHFLKDIMSRSDYNFSIKLPIIFDPQASGFKKAVCHKIWAQLDVNERGDIALCCQLQHDPEVGNIFNGYDFNSPKMMEMRQRHIDGNFPPSCQFCHRRFPEQHYALFNARSQQWKVYGYTK